MIQIDEIGRYFQNSKQKNSPSYLLEVSTLIMQAFSQANGILLGKEYANSDKKRDRQDILQPCLSIHGLTVLSRLTQSFTSEDAVDGFLSRWLVFKADYNLNRVNGASISDPPPELIEYIKTWDQYPTNVEAKGNLDREINPKKIPFDSEASRTKSVFEQEIMKQMAEEYKKGTGLEAIFARVAEHAQKLALIAHDDYEEPISSEVYSWASALALERAEFLVSIIKDNIAANEIEAQTKKILAIVKKAGEGGITQNKLTRKTQDIARPRRNDILNDLLGSDLILAIEDEDTGGRPSVTYYFNTEFEQ